MATSMAKSDENCSNVAGVGICDVALLDVASPWSDLVRSCIEVVRFDL